MSPEIPAPKFDLDSSLYKLGEDECTFLKSQTGIESDEELKEYILAVQKEAYEIYPYPCIWAFGFTGVKISLLPAYQRVLNLGKEHKDAIFLDMACCFGNDVRKIVSDGFPVCNVIASDYRGEFWKIGHELFKSTPKSFPAAFVVGDAFDDDFISPAPVTYGKPATPTPPLTSLTTLSPLQGRIAAIHTSSFFHLFKESEQFELAKRMASLLSPDAGSIIFGSHVGRKEKGEIQTGKDAGMSCHSPESWSAMWNGDVFTEGSVKVDAILIPVGLELGDKWKSEFLVWSVARL